MNVTNRFRLTSRVRQWRLLILLLLMCLTGCHTSRHAEYINKDTGCLSSKVTLTIPTSKEAILTVNGILKLKSGERMQISFLMPILRTEVARIDLTPEEVLLVDRMGRRYVQISHKELKSILPKKASFARLEKMLYEAARPGAKNYLTGTDLGIPSLKQGKIELTDFSSKPFNLAPTRLSSRYKQVEPEELLGLLLSLLNN